MKPEALHQDQDQAGRTTAPARAWGALSTSEPFNTCIGRRRCPQQELGPVGEMVKSGTVSLNLRRDSDQRTSAYGQESIRWSLVFGCGEQIQHDD
ncbi:hypothetical protein F2Q69_00024121 [Brassica cretica]|uniref:Uncharacterized protein n=1 Tax=Brassica cretica TaxID=69181 RepID=A0A8S9Q6U3_BRACR|nr:hypothetical protein F2Q69_00024121 [Brassica cretica]